ncbi:hypothetical protein XELAEV_18041954mg, partial [Xenopus laevis]
VLSLKELRNSSQIARSFLTSDVILMCQIGFEIPTVKAISRLLNALPIGMILMAKLKCPINDFNLRRVNF